MFKSIKDKMGKASSQEKLSKRQHDIVAFDKISANWNLENIQEYVRGKNTNQELSDIGMASIIQRFIHNRKEDSKMESGQRREFEIPDRSERTKKGFDIVISIANNISISTDTLPLLQEFIELYSDVIQDFDKKLSQTYESKLKQAYKNAEVNALTKSQFKRELDFKYKS